MSAKGTMQVSPWKRRLMGALVGLMAVAGFAAIGVTQASAGPTEEPLECKVVPEFKGNAAAPDNTTGLFAASRNAAALGATTQLWAPNDPRPKAGYTVWDAVGMAGARWSFTSIGHQLGASTSSDSNTFKRVGGAEGPNFYCDPTVATHTFMSNAVFDGAKQTVAFALGFRAFSQKPAPVVQLLDEAVQPASSIYRTTYVGAMVCIIMLLGIWLTLQSMGRAEKRAGAGQKVIVGCLTLVAGAMLLQPVTRATASDSAMSEAGGGTQKTAPLYYWLTMEGLGVSEKLAATVSSVIVPSPGRDSVCYIDKAPDEGAQARQNDCLVYESLVYEPWVQGQFGSADVSKVDVGATFPKMGRFKDSANGWVQQMGPAASSVDIALLQLRAQSLTGWDVAPGQADDKAVPGDSGSWELSDKSQKAPATQQDRWNIVREYMYTYQGAAFTDWAGQGDARLGLAVVSLFTAILIAAFVVICAALMLLWNIVLVLLAFLLPVCALLGAFPPLQRFFKDWLATWATAFVWLVLGGAVQMTGMILTAAVMKLQVGMFMRAVLTLLLLIALVLVLKKVHQSGFAQVSLTGQTSLFDPSAAAASSGRTARQVVSRVTEKPTRAVAGLRESRKASTQQGREAVKQERMSRTLANSKWADERVKEQLAQQGLTGREAEKAVPNLRRSALAEAEARNPARSRRDIQLATGVAKPRRRERTRHLVGEVESRLHLAPDQPVKSTVKIDKIAAADAARRDELKKHLETLPNPTEQARVKVQQLTQWSGSAEKAAEAAKKKAAELNKQAQEAKESAIRAHPLERPEREEMARKLAAAQQKRQLEATVLNERSKKLNAQLDRAREQAAAAQRQFGDAAKAEAAARNKSKSKSRT